MLLMMGPGQMGVEAWKGGCSGRDFNPQAGEGGSSGGLKGPRIPSARIHATVLLGRCVFLFHHLSGKGEEGVRLPPSSLAFGRIMPVLRDGFPGVSTSAAMKPAA